MYGAGGIVGFTYKKNGTSTNYYYRKNLQGDIVAIYGENGTKYAEYAYDAWGNCTVLSDANGIGALNPFRYRGYYYDSEIKLYYLNARYYDPEVGRFVSQDDIKYIKPKYINGLNLYSYCYSNPVIYVDPTGNLATWIIVIIFVAAVSIVSGATLIYGAVAEEPVVLDISISFPIGAGANLKLGISAVFDFKNNRIEFYPHAGVSMGLSSGPSFSGGVIKNYKNEGDYEGPFVFAGAGYYGGIDHCYDPTAAHSDAVQATSITIGWKGSAYIGYDEYFYWKDLTIRW